MSIVLYVAPFCINALNLIGRGCKLCRFRNVARMTPMGSLSLFLSLTSLVFPFPPNVSALRLDFSPPSLCHERRGGIPRDYGSTRYYLQRTYVTFRTAYYCDYRRIMRRPSRSTIYYWIAIIRTDRQCPTRWHRVYTRCCGKRVTQIKFLYAWTIRDSNSIHCE